MKQLTIIIPFLNEGEEVFNTLDSIRNTTQGEVDLILINDASDDDCDYRKVADEFKAHYICHEKRIGVAASRDEGIGKCRTEFFLLLDAHMRFYQTDWEEKIVAVLKKNPRMLLCCQTIPLYKNKEGAIEVYPNAEKVYGAYIDFGGKDILDGKWSTYDPDPDQPVVDIPCILGAGYACNKTYWLYLRGLEGLCGYGLDEQLISLKVGLEGGSCRLSKDVRIGHIYRDKLSVPYPVQQAQLVYNKLFIAQLLLPVAYKTALFQYLFSEYPVIYREGMNRVIAHKDNLLDQKRYFQRIFTRSVYEVIQRHQDVRKRIVQNE